MALALIYFLSIGVVALYFWVSRGTWNKLIALSSFSTKMTLFLVIWSFLNKDFNTLSVAFFYLVASLGGIMLFAYFMSRRGAS